ncbi:MAG: DNA-binding response regulator [Gammaproteobacteria bacterium]|nr:MAG: DNA-binding response regulator [Gammaproteobacteria bacterium]
MSARVLIVEDEAKLAELLRDYFVQAGFETDVLGRGDGVEAHLARREAELVILDLQLPGKDGLEVCKALRAHAVLRRLRAVPAGDSLRVGGLELQRGSRRVLVQGDELALTRIEFELLATLMEQPQRVWSRAQLLERVRGTDLSAWERNIDGHVKNLRAKLRPYFKGASPIRSVYGVGYGLDSMVLGT